MAEQREDKFKTHRMIQIDKWIRSGSYPGVEQMMAEYGVSRRTILRDIEFLRDRYCAPVEYDKNRKGYFYSDSTFMIQNVLLTEGDLFTVSTLSPYTLRQRIFLWIMYNDSSVFRNSFAVRNGLQKLLTVFVREWRIKEYVVVLCLASFKKQFYCHKMTFHPYTNFFCHGNVFEDNFCL